MNPFDVLGHDKLVTLAHKTQAAAHDHDPDRLEASALRLYVALADHMAAEHPALLRVPPADARLLGRGQQRVVDELVELAAMAAAGSAEDCQCAQVADDLLAELTLQTEDERRLLRGEGAEDQGAEDQGAGAAAEAGAEAARVEPRS